MRGWAFVLGTVSCLACAGRSNELEEGGPAGRGGTGANGGTGALGGSAGSATAAGGSDGGAASGGVSGAGTGGTNAGSSNASGGASGANASRGGSGTSVGGASGTGGSAAGGFAGTAGEGGAMSLVPPASWPAWLPYGVFGEAADDMIRAAIEHADGICSWFLVCEGDTDEERIALCVAAELKNLAPTPEWLACISRDPNAREFFVSNAHRLRACKATPSDCSIPPPCTVDVVPIDYEACGTREYENQELRCLDDRVPPPRRCDGEVECPDGDDESNCDPLARQYDCAHGQLIDWQQLCNGTADCDNGSDELHCDRP